MPALAVLVLLLRGQGLVGEYAGGSVQRVCDGRE